MPNYEHSTIRCMNSLWITFSECFTEQYPGLLLLCAQWLAPHKEASAQSTLTEAPSSTWTILRYTSTCVSIDLWNIFSKHSPTIRSITISGIKWNFSENIWLEWIIRSVLTPTLASACSSCLRVPANLTSFSPCSFIVNFRDLKSVWVDNDQNRVVV